LKKRLEKELADTTMRRANANGQDTLTAKRNAAFEELGNYEEWRENAAAVRHHVLENLDFYLTQFAENASKNGAHVTFTRTASEATDAALEILQKKGVKKAVKSKSMVTEEIGLNDALEEIGVEIVETDLANTCFRWMIKISRLISSFPLCIKTDNEYARFWPKNWAMRATMCRRI